MSFIHGWGSKFAPTFQRFSSMVKTGPMGFHRTSMISVMVLRRNTHSATDNAKEFQYQKLHSKSLLDPRTQRFVLPGFAGLNYKFHATDVDEIPVTGRVTDLQAWERFSGLRPGINVKKGNEWLVTARVPANFVESLRGESFVSSLKVAQIIRPLLRRTIPEIGLTEGEGLTKDVLDQGGEGTVVGIVDYFGDFVHEHFRTDSGDTRITHIWDQRGVTPLNSSVPYGKEHRQQDIDWALTKRDPYRALKYGLDYGFGEHGTHVMDIAAGSGPVPGIAPKAELMFVDIATKAYGFPEVAYSDFGDSVRVIEAVKYIFDQAGDKPCVVNLSLGTNGGPHDGTNPVEQFLDAFVKEKHNRAVVVAASNSHDDGIHKTGKVKQGEYVELTWEIPQTDYTNNEMEIWYSKDDKMSLEVLDHEGNSLGFAGLGQSGYFSINVDGSKRTIGFVAHKEKDDDNQDRVIHLYHFTQNDPINRDWTFRLHGEKVTDETGTFHAWIERDNHDRGIQTNFEVDNSEYTLGSISTGLKSIVVGSYNAHSGNTPISSFSSSGPTRDERHKPEVSAPGHWVRAASSKTGNGTERMSGTSMAAPAVAGLIARIFGRAKEQGIDLSIDETRKILKETARKTPKDHHEDWHPRYGYGRISGQALKHQLLLKD